MPLVIPVAGAMEQLDILLKLTLAAGGGEYDLGLFTNDYVPDRTTVWADLTEAVFDGYARIFLARTGWGDIEADDEDRAKVTFATDPLVFELDDDLGTPLTVYGHFVLNPTTNTVVWLERWTSPRTLEFEGDKIEITLPFTYTFEGNPP